jgi:hypothetical protein
LATELLTEANSYEAPPAEGGEPEGVLPLPISRSRDRLRTADTELAAVLQPQVVPPEVKKAADRAIDKAWSAFFKWLSGWCELPATRHPHTERALHLFNLCFFEGLKFTLRPYKIEWKDSQIRLEAIDHEGHRETFGLLGGEPFLAELNATQTTYGEVLGITAPKSPAELATLGTKRDAVLTAIREYVTKVAAHPDPEEPGSQELCDRLLRPLAEWESREAAATSETAGAAPPPTGTDTPVEPTGG